MMISTKGRYALRALADMAEHRSEQFIPLRDIATRQEISEKYLESIMKMLVKDGYIVGLRGKGGGYRLAKDPDQIVVGDILKLTEGELAPVSCLETGAVPCHRMSYCPTIGFWQGLYDVVNNYVMGFTILDLIREGQAGNDYVI